MRDIKIELIFLRNKFLNGVFNDEDKVLLDDIYKYINIIPVEMTRNILAQCINEIIDEVNSGNIVNAGFIINFVHNLPFSVEEMKKWDVEYFLTIEIETLTDRVKSISSAARLVLCACHHIYVERYGAS